MELGELSRAIGKDWSVLWPDVRKLEERKDVGRALSPDEERRLLAMLAVASPNSSPLLGTIIRIALLTGMRIGEILELTWAQVNLASRMVTVGRAKTEAGSNRDIPMNENLLAVFHAHAGWYTERFGATLPEHYLFPFGSPQPNDPTRHVTDISNAWSALRKRAGVKCRIHDLRHTVATKMAEAGVPEGTMKALLGHMSRAMLERYSHIRTKAKREAVESLTLADSIEVPTNSPTVEAATFVN
jgi:integrase